MNKATINKETIKAISNRVDIVQIIEGYVRLKPSGKSFSGLCPFHNEKSPSFIVSPDKQSFHCFGCGTHGDAISFLIEIERLTFIESVERLASIVGIQLNYNKFSNNKSVVINIMTHTLKYFRKNLLDSPQELKDYISKRSISKQILDTFLVGYAPKGWDNLKKYLIGINFKIEDIERLGLVKLGEKGNYYDRMRGRLIFPVKDSMGKIIGFSGRSINAEEPKYLNPPETELYKKSSVFYGLFEAKEDIRKKDRIFISEGYLDVMRLYESGFKESVATCGTSLTDKHIKVLERLRIKRVYLVFDGDKAGQSAAEKSAKLFLQTDIESYIVILPDQLDPDDYFKVNSSSDFESLIRSSKLDYLFLIDNVVEIAGSLSIDQQALFIQELVLLGKKINNEIKRNLFFNILSTKFGIKEPLYVSTKNKIEKTSEKENSLRDKWKQSKYRFEIEALNMLLTQFGSYQYFKKYLLKEDFVNIIFKNLYTRVFNLEEEELQELSSIDLTYFFAEFSGVILKILDIDIGYKNDEFTEKVVKEIAYKIKKSKILSEYLTLKEINEKEAVSKKQNMLEKIKYLLQ